jgi:purine-binding chemotaxis protein CheW
VRQPPASSTTDNLPLNYTTTSPHHDATLQKLAHWTSASVAAICASLQGGIMETELLLEQPSSATGTTVSLNVTEFLAYRLGKEEYGIDIQKVQELRGYDAVTAIANAPAHIKGVVNLRGIIVPIIDMRIKFNLGDPVYDQFTVVIILNLAGRIVGMVVDSVSDVITLEASQIRPAPAMGANVETDYLLGMGTIDERMLILVDIDRLMASAEIGLVTQ